MTAALLGGPVLSSQGVAGQLSSRKLTLGPTKSTGRLPKMTAEQTTIGRLWSQRRSLPSYISSKSFGEAVIDLVIPDPQGQQTELTSIEEIIGKLPPSLPFRQSLESLVKDADGDVGRFRTSVEQWYDDHMDRVSGWYKRHVGKITLVAGAVVSHRNARTRSIRVTTSSGARRRAASQSISTMVVMGTTGNRSDSSFQSSGCRKKR